VIDLLAGLLLQGVMTPDDPGVVCILGRLDAATRVAIVAEMEPENAASHPGTDAFDRAVDHCAEGASWPPEATGNRAGVATALILRDDAADVLARAGIAPAQVEAALDRLGPNARITMPTDADGERMVEDLAAHGVARDVLERNGAVIGHYLGGLIVLARVARGLPIAN
jgi:hypothetical protein